MASHTFRHGFDMRSFDIFGYWVGKNLSSYQRFSRRITPSAMSQKRSIPHTYHLINCQMILLLVMKLREQCLVSIPHVVHPAGVLRWDKAFMCKHETPFHCHRSVLRSVRHFKAFSVTSIILQLINLLSFCKSPLHRH
jgi:hypothetical protein